MCQYQHNGIFEYYYYYYSVLHCAQCFNSQHCAHSDKERELQRGSEYERQEVLLLSSRSDSLSVLMCFSQWATVKPAVSGFC